MLSVVKKLKILYLKMRIMQVRYQMHCSMFSVN